MAGGEEDYSNGLVASVPGYEGREYRRDGKGSVSG